jgi:hypothetical protein
MNVLYDIRSMADQQMADLEKEKMMRELEVKELVSKHRFHSLITLMSETLIRYSLLDLGSDPGIFFPDFISPHPPIC